MNNNSMLLLSVFLIVFLPSCSDKGVDATSISWIASEDGRYDAAVQWKRKGLIDYSFALLLRDREANTVTVAFESPDEVPSPNLDVRWSPKSRAILVSGPENSLSVIDNCPRLRDNVAYLIYDVANQTQLCNSSQMKSRRLNEDDLRRYGF